MNLKVGDLAIIISNHPMTSNFKKGETVIVKEITPDWVYISRIKTNEITWCVKITDLVKAEKQTINKEDLND